MPDQVALAQHPARDSGQYWMDVNEGEKTDGMRGSFSRVFS